jgi:hypothetical protein
MVFGLFDYDHTQIPRKDFFKSIIINPTFTPSLNGSNQGKTKIECNDK